MATFNAVNNTESHVRNEDTPLTPRPNTAPSSQIAQMSRDDAKTPTRANFGGLASQQPLPSPSEFPPKVPVAEPSQVPIRTNSQHTSSTSPNSSGDVDMDDGEDEGDQDGEEETEVITNPDGTKSIVKKKNGGKTQRFYCTDYAPCNLSFTRSEHLARHIRKHTGERPFECHCGRKFSRLDNLRQHAQTVHQNEDIPQDSLAATGTRFQRTVRTERVRPPGSRSRANTASSITSSHRGHTRNSLSASSISSVGTSYTQRDDSRRRPPPLVMAGEPRARYSQEIYRAESPVGQYGYRQQSPGGFSTPTSATYSNGPNSPRWNSGMQSPAVSHSRTQSLYADHRTTPARRLSVPSAIGNPFQSPHGYGPPGLGQVATPSTGAFSPTSSIASPTSSIAGSMYSRRDSNAGDDFRRRTWHPETYSNLNAAFTSRLQQVATPNYYAVGTPPQPPVVPSNAPPLRLPGIESFDPLHRPTTPIRRQPSPMMIDTPSRPPVEYQVERPTSQHWDQGINRNMNRLDLGQAAPDAASSWASEANRAVQAQAEQVRQQPNVRFSESHPPERYEDRAAHEERIRMQEYSQAERERAQYYAQQHASAPPITPRTNKRQAWYNGPVTQPPPFFTQPIVPSQPVQRTEGREENVNAWVEARSQEQGRGAYTYAPAQQQQQQHQQQQHARPNTGHGDRDNSALDVLVAVATREEGVAAAY